MSKTKIILALVVALALAVGQVALVRAAPPLQATTTTVTIDSVTPITDPGTGAVTGYTVVYTYGGGFTTSVDLSIADAEAWGLLQIDPVTGLPLTDPVTGDPLLVDPLPTAATLDTTLTGADPCVEPDGAGPVGGALTGFFCGSQGVSYDTIMGWQTSGYGFGVIAQSLFMAQALGSDPALAAAILAAKASGDYSALYALGVPTDISNWGQLKKWVMTDEVKSLTNLGAIMSGRGTPLVTAPATTTTTTTHDSQHGSW